MKFMFTVFSVALLCLGLGSVASAMMDDQPITIRTESYQRPPYSGATYFIYERDGAVICTKLEVCNKFGDCDSTYFRGSMKDAYDIETGAPYSSTEPVEIRPTSLKKHVCLTRFRLI